MNQTNRNRGLPLVVLCVAALWVWGAGCNGCVVNPGQDGGGGGDGGDGGGSQNDGGTPDGGGPTEITDAGCVKSGTLCSGTVPCCSGNCNVGVCGVAPMCNIVGANCNSNLDCCSGDCALGKCSDTRCGDVGQTCTNDTNCCSGNCNGTTCATQSGSGCLALGSSCTAGGTACCSQNCRDGVCQRASSCQTSYDVCYRDEDCCSLLCTGTGGNAGYCDAPTASPCWQAGTPCSDGNNCCSETCADPGSGRKVCQAASGCRIEGDSCVNSLVCCGGEPYGPVVCDTSKNSLCSNGTACNAAGAVCGKPVLVLPDGGYECARDSTGTCISSSSNSNCCGGFNLPGGRNNLCRLDRVGVPRCHGGGGDAGCPNGFDGTPGCCVTSGSYCDFTDQCCSGALCIPGDGGVRTCTVPQCLAMGNTCTLGGTGADACCAGTDCLPVNEITYACQIPSSNPDGGSCRANGSSCSVAGDCCSQLCDQNVCVAPTCQPQGATCTFNGDCCVPLTCSIPSGSTTGTCQPSGTGCPDVGQPCSPSNLCCNEGTSLQCLGSTGFPCDGTTACTCNFIFGKPDPGFSSP